MTELTQDQAHIQELKTQDLSPAEIERRLHDLREEHRDLDAAVSAMMQAENVDQIRLMRLKKKKLILRDQIQYFEDLLNPDIIA